MKSLLLTAAFFLCFISFSCNSSDSNTSKTKEPPSPADSLLHEVNEGHDAVMPKMGKVRGAQKELQRMVDSIAKLPAKAQLGAAAVKAKLEELINQLNYADFAMDKWMMEFNRDSALSNAQERIQYLTNEKLKVDKVKEAVLTGLARADSILKSKF